MIWDLRFLSGTKTLLLCNNTQTEAVLTLSEHQRNNSPQHQKARVLSHRNIQRSWAIAMGLADFCDFSPLRQLSAVGAVSTASFCRRETGAQRDWSARPQPAAVHGFIAGPWNGVCCTPYAASSPLCSRVLARAWCQKL